ncbi:TIGR00730 family Rossman fold protein [Alcaligenaceae bacterium]|nr:TIGR00730 family Rossman fold protein [Alcaligenaceae bacterium]
MAELKAAAETLKEINWGVSVFGSARTKPGTPYYILSEAMGARLAKGGFTVIAGGGPGIMEAANKGAYQAGGNSVGLNIQLPKETTNNQYQTHSLNFDYFYSRKATFFMHSAAYIALPGGFGTLDEVLEVLTLVQTGKLAPAPIVLMGVEYWTGLLEWMKDHLIAQGLIGPHDLDLMTLTDDPNVVMAQIEEYRSNYSHLLDCEPALPE